ncbi:MAG: SDR family oxidoreductase [Aestuariibacter sp.]
MANKVLITGGNSGIGFATAIKMKNEGLDVIISGRSTERLEKAAKEIGCDFFKADISKLNEIELLAEYVKRKGINFVVLNAAAAVFKPIEETDESDFEYFINANIKGSYFLIKWLLPTLSLSKGAITIVTSAVVENGLPNASLYALTKGAMDSLVKSLAVETAAKGVRINAVAPGAIDTPILDKLGIPKEAMAEIRSQQEQMIPLKRYGYASEIADVIYGQLHCTYVTGATWEADGGVNAI